ncbi:S9 family peptidase [Catalinimonas niigatensis]|uniref:S9 family peptidase n=1 Tax=Catalinimonas niigatensis TaxID=1397264 RepID=UPI002664FD8F|nr:S9 family peptidase [Catalinimonas niigatensis]WPP51293.1 DPP IV N-terminal domain-containing protein [Catalinimonas niigatensis]
MCNTKKYKKLLTYLIFFFLSSQQILLAQQHTYENLREALFSSAQLVGDSGPKSINWIDNGERFSFIETTEEGKQLIKTHNPKNGKEEVVFDASDVTFPDSNEPFTYRSFQWSKDSKYILFQTKFNPIWRNSGNADYYYYSVDDKSLKLVAEKAFTAEVSPDGTKVGYGRNGNLFVYDFATGKDTQLTFDAKDQIYNGRFGWAYEEEFGLVQAWKWSPDSRFIAYWQSDESKVPIYLISDYSDQHPEYQKIPYPKVGDTNPTVKVGVIDLQDNSQQWMDTELDGGYIPRIYWTSETGQLAVVHLNRAQTHLKLFFQDVITGKGKLIMEERSEAWIDVFDFFAGIMDLFFFPEDAKEFFWISDRDGWSHLYRYDYQGNLVNQVTSGEWEVVLVHAVDSKSKTIYYSSTEDSSLDRQLYSVNYQGNKKKKLTDVEGRHAIHMSPHGKYYLDKYSNINSPVKIGLYNNDGKLLETIVENAEVEAYVNQHFYSPRELFSFTTEGGVKLDGYVVKPKDFDENKAYPLVLNIYGGPGAQSVYNEFGTNGWEQYLAQQGYVVASINNRGSGGYGSEFEKGVYKQLGILESADFVATANYLAEKSWVDVENMAIRGHSYGGYMSSFTSVYRPGVFKAAIIGAPVTDWRLYDSIYAERYMGLLEDNEDQYLESSSTAHAADANAKLFIAHSMMDENVHAQNTFQFVKALIDAGKDHELRIYPPGAHGVAYNGESYVLLYQQYTDFLDRYLKE